MGGVRKRHRRALEEALPLKLGPDSFEGRRPVGELSARVELRHAYSRPAEILTPSSSFLRRRLENGSTAATL